MLKNYYFATNKYARKIKTRTKKKKLKLGCDMIVYKPALLTCTLNGLGLILAGEQMF